MESEIKEPEIKVSHEWNSISYPFDPQWNEFIRSLLGPRTYHDDT